MGISIGKVILGLLGLWLVVIIMLSGPLFHNTEPDEQVLARLTRAVSELEALKQQNEELRGFLNSLKLPHHAVDEQAKLAKETDLHQQRSDGFQEKGVSHNVEEESQPSKQHELLMRRVMDGVMEMWWFVRGETKKLNATLRSNNEMVSRLNTFLEDTSEHKRALLTDLEDLHNIDNKAEWRQKEAEELSDIISKRLHSLQNPKDCQSAKKLICSLNKGCGYGCQIHHVVYCLIVAYGTQRTLILKSSNWRYAKKGWESVFKPLSETCTDDSGGSHSPWPGTAESQVIDLPIVDNVRPRPAYLPLAIPKEISDRLIRLHGNPSAWWIGQFLKYLLRPQDVLTKILQDIEKKLDFQHPIVGIHVRRTDKIGTEASFHAIEEYMEFAEDFFKRLELKQAVQQRRVYLATDDPNLLNECRSKYPQYVFLGDPNIAKSASLGNRYSDESLKGIIVDIHMLAHCDYLVCTFSSQVCRLAYEIMQSLHPDASTYFHSLDDIFYFGGQNDHNQLALYDHKPHAKDEVELRQGDVIGIAGNHWDGYSRGLNKRTKKSGIYPSFKAVDKIDVIDFPN